MSHHVLSLLVEDKPGLLTRVAGLFARRGFNINSLAVGPTEVPGLSRITVVAEVDQLPLEQVTKQLNKLVNVIKIVELDPDASVYREHLLIKVRVDNTTRSQILEAVKRNRRRALIGPDAKGFDLVSRLPAAVYQRSIVRGAKLGKLRRR